LPNRGNNSVDSTNFTAVLAAAGEKRHGVAFEDAKAKNLFWGFLVGKCERKGCKWLRGKPKRGKAQPKVIPKLKAEAGSRGSSPSPKRDKGQTFC
jgi:hypothetical protein